MTAGLEMRAARLARQHAAAARRRIAARIGDEVAGIEVRTDDETIVITGRRLRARLLTEPALRWIGSLAR